VAIELEDVVSRLGVQNAREALADGWQQALEERPESLEFLDPDFVREAAQAVYLPPEIVDGVVADLPYVVECDAAVALCWYVRWWLYEQRDYGWGRFRSWPDLQHALDGHGGLIYVLVTLSNYREMQRVHAQHDIPEDVARNTLYQLERRMRLFREEHGEWGLPPVQAGWFSNHLRGIIYRLARLQFQFADSRYSERAFRNDATEQTVVLAGDGVRYREDGQRLREGDDAAGAWTASFSREGGEIVGYPIDPRGFAVKEQIRLPEREWREALGPGDPVLQLHIPGGEPMYYDQCGEAFEQALEFFPRHFPDYEFAGFACSSWILDTALQALLPDESNLVRFQREVYLLPIGLSDDSLPHNIFDGVPEDLSKAPRETSLQRAYLDAMAGDGLTTGGGGLFLLPEDLNWGAQVYLHQEMPYSSAADR